MKKFTCRYNKDCWISIENIDNKPIMKLDFKIKTYQVLKHGWRDYNFPDDIAINDKLYLTKEMVDKIIQLFDYYLENSSLEDPEAQLTNRGFSYLELKDLYGNTISTQESSALYNLWFGCRTKNKAYLVRNGEALPYEFPEGDLLITDRLHLNKSKIKQLKRTILKEWDKHTTKLSTEV